MAANIVTKAVIFLSLITFSIAGQLDVGDATKLLADTWQHLANKTWPASYDERWLESVMLNNSLHQLQESNVSPRCVYDLTTWIDSLRKGEMWAIQSE